MNSVVRSGSKARLLGHVGSLWHTRDGGWHTRDPGGWHFGRANYPMGYLTRDSGEYLSALRNLHSLTLLKITVQHISEGEYRTCFSAFRETLTYLSLDTFITPFSAFATLVDYFPNIKTLRLQSFQLDPDQVPVPPLSRPLRGELRIYEDHPICLEFLDRFAKLDLEYEELIIGSSSPAIGTEFVKRALQISARTAKYLRFASQLDRE